MDNSHLTPFWGQVLKIAETEPRDQQRIQGISGVQHDLLGLGVDEKRGRLVLISDDPDARSAAMMQADIKATLDAGTNVIVIRPITIDLPGVARDAIDLLGATSPILDLNSSLDMEAVQVALELKADKILHLVSATLPSILPQIMQLIQQLALIDLRDAQGNVLSINPKSSKELVPSETGEPSSGLGVGRLAQTDLAEFDRRYGICPLPLYQLSNESAALVDGGAIYSDVEAVVTELGMMEYIFPSPDQTVLGIVDRGIGNRDIVASSASNAPALGHPLAANELVGDVGNILDVIDALKHEGFLVAGEIDLEMGEKGQATRSTVRFQSREGLISKIINRLNINLSPADLFKP